MACPMRPSACCGGCSAPALVGERQARLIDENFIQPLDLNDNTGEQNSLCDAIGFF